MNGGIFSACAEVNRGETVYEREYEGEEGEEEGEEGKRMVIRGET